MADSLLNLCATQDRTNYDNVVSYVHILLVPSMQERSEAERLLLLLLLLEDLIPFLYKGTFKQL